jgi:hypothetical protein
MFKPEITIVIENLIRTYQILILKFFSGEPGMNRLGSRPNNENFEIM